MKTAFTLKMSILLVILIGAGLAYAFSRSPKNEKISELGRYQGYSEKIYDSHIRRSSYLTLADGPRLAYDLILPAKDNLPAAEPLPTPFMPPMRFICASCSAISSRSN